MHLYLLIGSLALLNLALLLRLASTLGVAVLRLNHYREEDYRLYDALRELEGAKAQLEHLAAVADGRARLNGQAHSEFRNRLEMAEQRINHTVTAVAELGRKGGKSK